MESIADFLARTAREREQRNAAAAGIVINSIDKSPDEVAGNMALAQDWAKTTGKPQPPLPVVEEYRSVFQKQIEDKRNSTILADAPKLSEWLKNPENAALARDDLTGLSWWERVSKSFRMGDATAVTQGQEFTRDIGTALERSALGRGLDALGEGFDRTVLSNEDGSPNLLGRLANWARGQGVAADGVPRQMVGGPDVTPDQRAEAIGSMDLGPLYQGASALLKEMEKAGFAPMSYKDVRGVGSALSFISENLAMSLPQMAAAMTSGGFSPLIQVLTLGGEANAELKERTDLSNGQRVAIATGAGTVMAALDYFGLGKVFGGLGAGKVATEAIEGTLFDRLVRSGLTEAAGRTIQAAIAEGTTEALQEAVVMGVTALSGGQYQASEVIDRFLQAFTAGAASGGAMRAGGEAVTGAGTAARRMAEGEGKAQVAADTQAQIAEIAGQAAASKLRSRMPDVFRAWVERATEGGKAETLYVPADKFTEYFQKIGMDPFALADEMDGVTADDLRTALETGGDLRIPTATYAAKLAGSEADAFFMENMRFDPDEFTSAEARAFEETKAELMAEAWAEAERAFQDQQSLRTFEAEIYDTMVERLRMAGRATDVATTEAALYPAFYRVMAERSGLTTEEFMRRYPLPQVRGDIPQGVQPKNVDDLTRTLAGARAARAAGVKQPQTPLLEWIATRGGIDDVGGELLSRNAAEIKRGRGRKTLRLARPLNEDGKPMLTPEERAGGKRFGWDDVAQAAVEAGFLSGDPRVIEWQAAQRDGTVAPDIVPALMDAIDAEMRGDAQLTMDELNAGPSQDEMLADLERYLAEVGVSLEDDDATIRQAIERDQAERGRMYGQDGRIATESEAFKAWLGDSKVVDADGDPLVVYHGTATDFGEFSKGADAKHIALPGFFFTPETGIAGGFAESASRRPFRDADGYIAGFDGATVMPVYLSIQNPAEINLDDRETGRMTRSSAVEEMLRAAQEAGHDGAIIRGWSDGSGETQYVAFEPTQIKSVFNRGTFDPNDPRILYQGAAPDTPLNRLLSGARERIARRNMIADQIAEAGRPVVMSNGDLRALVGPNTIAGEKPFRVTYMGADGKPNGHVEAETLRDAAVRAMEDGFEPVGAGYGQGAPDQPLYVVHNLNAEKLRKAAELGGLAAPSLAVARGDIGFDSFGEISLVGDPSLADPKSKGVRLFNADVYSPRQPRARFKVDAKAARALNAAIRPVADKMGLEFEEIEAREIERDGLSAIDGQMVAKAAWLDAIGEDVPVVREAPDEPMPVSGMGMFSETDAAALVNNPAFIDRLKRKHELAVKKNKGNDDLIARINAAWLNEDGSINDDTIIRWASDVAAKNREIEAFRAKPQGQGRISRYLTGKAIDDAIGDRIAQFNGWVRENFGGVTTAMFFETEAGRKQDYTLSNLVREMTRTIRNGENWNYGAGNVRAAVAPEFKSLAEVKAARDQIVSDKAMEVLKDEVNTELFALADKFAPYAGTEGKQFGWGDNFSEFLRDVAKGPRAVAQWPWAGAVPDEVMADAVAFLEKLKGLPTNYFEIKMQRAMRFDEFTAALVPSNLPADARKILTDAGLELVEYQKGDDGAGRIAALAEIGPRVFFQEQRGSIQFPGAGVGNGDTIISLFRKADLSTFVHETGHYFLTVMQDMAARGETGAVQEFEAVKTWWRSNASSVAKDAMRVMPDVKVTEADVIRALDAGTTGDIMLDAAIDVGMQEQWARGFEEYLMEGKAPSVELRGAFEKFRAWLVSIYRRLTGLNVEVSDDLRGVFDRLLATDAEIEVARQKTGDTGPMFKAGDNPGLSPEDFDRYQAIARQAQDEAASRLLAETMAPIKREAEAAYRAEKDAVRAEVEPQVNARREYRAIEWMGNRRWLGGDKPVGLPDMRLSRRMLVERYGEGVLKTLPRGKFPLYDNMGGVDPEIAAGLFGFGSGDEMIRALEQAPRRADAITAEVERLMFERHGDPLRDGTVEAKAIEAVHGDKRARMLALELDILRAQPGGTKSAVSVFREMARGTLARMPVRDAMAANRYLTAERKAGEASYRAFSNGDLAGAAEAKRRQLLNHMLYTEAKKIEAEVDGAERLAQRLQKKSTRDKLAGDYLEAIDEILGRYDFRRISGKAEERRGALLAYVERMKAEGRENELAIPDRVLQDAARIPYKRLTVEHLRGVIDSLKNIEHTARLKQKLIDAQSQRELDAVVDDILGSFDANVKERPPGRVGTNAEKLRTGARQFLDLVLNATTLLREIDGFKDMGAAYANLKAPIDEAMNRLQVRREKAAIDLDALYAVYTKAERRQMAVREFIPEIGASLSKWERISVALNMGNEGNYQRLTDTKVRGGFSEAQVKAIVATLDERDARFVQSVWDYLDSFRPDIEAREKRVTGVAPKWVEGRPVTIAGIELKGGYYPLKYDARLSAMSRDDAANDIANSLQAGRFGKAQTRNGHLKERATSSGRPVELDISVLHRHVQQVVYDLELSEPVSNSWRVLQDGRIRDAFINAGKQADFDALEIWLKDVAEGELRSADVAGRMARRFKSNFTAAKLAFNISTVALQITGVAQSMVVVGKADFLRGVQASLRRGVRDEVFAKSDFMRERSTTFNKDIFDLYNDPRMGPVATRWQEIRNDWIAPAGFYLMTKVQSWLVDVPTWLAGYQQGLRMFGGDEAKAIAHADGIVKRAQASGLFSDRSAVERGSANMRLRQNEFLRLFTTLGSYMFAKFNVAYERTGRARQVIEREGVSLRSAQEALSWTIDVAFLFTLEAVLFAAIKGGLPDAEDDEDRDGMTDEWAKFLAGQTGLSFIGTIPFVRDLGSVLTGFGGGGAYGAITEELAKPLVQIGQGEIDKQLVKSVINATGLATGLPSGQINRAVDAGWRQAEGEDVSPAEYLLGRIGQ